MATAASASFSACRRNMERIGDDSPVARGALTARGTPGAPDSPLVISTGKAELYLHLSEEQVRNHSKEASNCQRKAGGPFSSRGNRGVPPAPLVMTTGRRGYICQLVCLPTIMQSCLKGK